MEEISNRNLSWHLKCELPAGEKICEIVSSAFYLGFYDKKIIVSGYPRSGHGFSRQQLLDLPQSAGMLEFEINYLGVETYLQINKPFFFHAIVRDKKTNAIIADSKVGKNFKIFRDERRLQSAPRYSFQRGFVEIYDYFRARKPVDVLPGEPEFSIARRSETPKLKPEAFVLYKKGLQKSAQRELKFWYDANPVCKGWLEGDSRKDMLQQVFEIDTEWQDGKPETTFKDGESLLYRLKGNYTGILTLEIRVEAACRLIALWDEDLFDGKVTWWRNDCAQMAQWILPEGNYSLHLLEPYTMQFLEFRLEGGPVEIKKLELLKVANPTLEELVEKSETPVLKAALNTLAQNCVDIFMDCPSRERAGWLCDSFLSARAYWHLTGDLGLETDFLENFLNSPQIGGKNVIPMCYPGDHPDGNFVPSNISWFILQLADYQNRGGDELLLSMFKVKVEKCVNYISSFKNPLGILSDLPGWLFMGWTGGQHLQSYVNFQQNLIFSKALSAAAKLYGNREWAEQGEELAKRIGLLFWDGAKFCDQLKFENGHVERTQEMTMDSQYLARLCMLEESRGESPWWRRLAQCDWRGQNIFNCKVWEPPVLFGLLWRWHALAHDNKREIVKNEIETLLAPMANRTGTLWEHLDDGKSLNHGCVGIVACLLDEEYDNFLLP